MSLKSQATSPPHRALCLVWMYISFISGVSSERSKILIRFSTLYMNAAVVTPCGRQSKAVCQLAHMQVEPNKKYTFSELITVTQHTEY